MAFDAVPAASALTSAWKRRERIRELPETIRPRTLPEAYDVQDRFIEEMQQEASGWKLGIASRNAMRQYGLDRPVAGRVLAPYCVHSGDTVVAAIGAPVTVEFEVAFLLSQDIEPGKAPERLLDMVAATLVTFELVQSRFVDFRAAGIPSFAADNGGFMAMVIGESFDVDRLDELYGSASVSVDGEPRARARSGDDLIDPFASLAGLTAHARERGVTLRRGEIVSTGSLTSVFDVAQPQAEIVASYLDASLKVTVQSS